MEIDRYFPITGKCYFKNIKIPKNLSDKKVIINIQNKDEKCFMWAILRSLNHTYSHPERVSKELKSQVINFNWKKINFPSSEKDATQFEKK